MAEICLLCQKRILRRDLKWNAVYVTVNFVLIWGFKWENIQRVEIHYKDNIPIDYIDPDLQWL